MQSLEPFSWEKGVAMTMASTLHLSPSMKYCLTTPAVPSSSCMFLTMVLKNTGMVFTPLDSRFLISA